MSHRITDPNGFLIVEGCPLTTFGVFDYGAGQLGLPGDPLRIVKVYRPEEEVNNPAALDSMKNLPFINEHEMLSGFDDEKTTAPEEKGVEGVLTSNVYFTGGWMRGDIKVFSRSLQMEIAKNKDCLSLGYGCEFIPEEGEFEGQPYEVVQRKLRGNHLALVGEGRTAGAYVLDGMAFDSMSFEIQTKAKEVQPMEIKDTAADSAVGTLQQMLPQFVEALKGFLAEEKTESAHADESQGSELGFAKKDDNEAASAEGQGDDLKAKVDSDKALNEDLKVAKAEDGEDLGALIGEFLPRLQAALGGTAKEATDSVEGLQNSPVNGAQPATDDSDTKPDGSSEVPAQKALDASCAQDAAIAGFYRDAAVKDRFYNRLSPVVGAFVATAMDSASVVAYGLKKLGLTAPKGAEVSVLDAYLTAHEKGSANVEKTTKHAMDSANTSSIVPELAAYLNKRG